MSGRRAWSHASRTRTGASGRCTSPPSDGRPPPRKPKMPGTSSKTSRVTIPPANGCAPGATWRTSFSTSKSSSSSSESAEGVSEPQMDTDGHRYANEMIKDELNALTEQIIACAFKVLNTLGPGFLERVYENALAHELRKSGHRVKQQEQLS